mgnify:CR=1 FL=1
MINGVYPHRFEDFTIVDSLIVSAIAILVVFIVLIIIILICSAFQKGMEKVELATEIKPRPENKILEEDEDAVAAALVATIDFNKETGKDARLVSIEKVEE